MSTRAASRMEEQMAALLEKMDQQNEQLQLLTRQQAERVDGIALKQKETDGYIDAIKGDLDSVKGIMDGRMSTMEESIAGLKSFHAEIGEQQKSLKQELREELLQELATSTSLGVTRLRPMAPLFVPSDATVGVVPGEGTGGGDSTGTGDAPGGGLDSSHVDRGATHSSRRREAISVGGGPYGDAETRGGGAATTPVGQQQRPAPFDGKLAWDAYRTQFELLAMMNRWSDAEKAAYLAISLRGPAATVLTNLPPEQRGSYEALTTALDTRFGLSHQTELNRMRLKARTRHRDESLAELAEDVEHLVRLAYPEAAESMVEVLAKDQFVDALPDEDMRLHIRQNKPATLRDALGTALELESYQLASKQKARFVREAQLEEKHPVQCRMTNQGAKEQTGDVLQQLVDALRQVTKGPSRPRQFPPPRKERNQSDRSNLVCWECKERGHRRRECPKRRSHPAETEVSQSGNEQ